MVLHLCDCYLIKFSVHHINRTLTQFYRVVGKKLDMDNPVVYIDDDGYEEFLEDNEIYTASGQDGITKAFAIVVNKDGKL